MATQTKTSEDLTYGEMAHLGRKRYLVTGGRGFVGSHVVSALEGHGVERDDIFIVDSKYDLRIPFNCAWLITEAHPDVIINCAAVVGGIGFNKKNPATVFYDNIMIGTNMMHDAYRLGVKKYVNVGTVCSYPKLITTPFKEEDLWNGYPEETNAPYGLAKKMQIVQARAYREQYGFNAISLLCANMYGIGDNFNPESSHVIPAIINRMAEAKRQAKPSMTVWGTGNATREFLNVKDGAEAIVLAAERYDKPEPINIGTGNSITIRALVELTSDLLGYKGEIIWDTSKPDGQPSRELDVSKAEKEFGFKAKIPFEEGLREVIEAYKEE